MDFVGAYQNFTILGVGVPPFSIFIKALPLAFLIYVSLYGDMLFSNEAVELANEKRPDEVSHFNPDRAHFLTGVRNLLSVLFCGVSPTMHGIWPAMTAIIADSYSRGALR